MNKIHKIFNHTFAALLIALFIFLTAISSAAQTTAFTYQGRLNDNSAAANGSYDMQFRVYDTASGGTQKGLTVTKTAVAVTNGIFTVTIDPSFPAFFNQAGNYLEISIRLNGGSSYTPLVPRQSITSAPYAVQSISSQNADSLAGIPATNYLQANGSGANLTNLNASNITAGTVPDARLAANVARTNAPNVFTMDQTINNANLFQSGGLATFQVNSGFVASGTFNGTGIIPFSGTGTRMMFYPKKAAFRAGSTVVIPNFSNGTEWDDVNIGSNSVAMGRNTVASGFVSTATGNNTTASGDSSTAMGSVTTASGIYSTALGFYGTASGNTSTSMGNLTTASGDYSTAMGRNTTASGNYSTAMGFFSTASGDLTTAMGAGASTNNFTGSFVYGDNSTSNFVQAAAANSWTIRAAGGYRFFSNSGLTAGVQLAAGGGAWSSLSDRNAKTNFAVIDSRSVLQKVLKMPITTWNYNSQNQTIRHIGPMAQDFYNAFNVGEDELHITTIDADGVALAAIQGLNAELQETVKSRDTQIQQLQQQLKRQQNAIDNLKQLVCQNNQAAEFCQEKK